MKNKTYLFVSILALIGGLFLILTGRADTFSIGLVLMGIIGTIAGMFLLINPEEKDDKVNKKEMQKNDEKPKIIVHVCDHSHCEEKNNEIKPVDNKIVCKYCKCKFTKNFDKCPYCGAPQK